MAIPERQHLSQEYAWADRTSVVNTHKSVEIYSHIRYLVILSL